MPDEKINVEDLQNTASSLVSETKYEESLESFDKLIRHYIDEIEYCGYRAFGLLKDGKTDEAVKFQNKVLSLEPELYKYRQRKADSLKKLGREREAQVLLDKNKKEEWH